MNDGSIPGGVSLKTGRHAAFFIVVNPMDNQAKARIAPFKNTWKRFSGHCNLVQVEARSTKRTTILSNKIKRSHSVRHTACISFIQRESVFLKLIRKVVHKDLACIRSKIILASANKCGELLGNPKNTADYRVPGISIPTVQTAGCTAIKTERHKTYRDVRKNIGIRNNSLKT